MFTKQLIEENPKLLHYGMKLFHEGMVEPDSYLIDLDTLLENAKKIITKAKVLDIKLYAMTKQFGRNPYIAKKLIELGYEGIVAVDFREAETLHKEGVKIAHLGHLVQIPNHLLESYVQMNPEVITVYSLEKIKSIDEVCKKLNRKQKILLKVVDKDSELYDMQESGFYLSELEGLIENIKELTNIEIEGITSFPCILFNNSEPQITKNLEILKRGKTILENLGYNLKQINSPSGTSIKSLDLLKENQCTHGEPGHSLTGTIPDLGSSREEKIAIMYLSEISHNFNGNSYCFGGGYYRRGNLAKGIMRDNDGWKYFDVLPQKDDSIDYYIRLSGEEKVGEPVFMCFRTQIFVTRSKVILVEGLSVNNPKIVGTWDSLGKKME